MNNKTSKQTESIESGYPGSVNLSRSLLQRVLKKLKRGKLTLIDGDHYFEFGDSSNPASLHATLIINNPAAYKYLLTGGDIGAGEAYMLGYWSSPDLVKLVRLMSINLELLNTRFARYMVLQGIFMRLGHFLNKNTITGSRKNISAHYDLSNNFFRIFLDPSMMYSSAIYPQSDSDLETASFYKLDEVCRKLRLNENDHLLEIGTGWGGMAMYAARNYGCRVTTTTISQQQYNFAKKRIKEAGLEHKITLLLKDYRELEGQFDKLVSIEMIEAVGHSYYRSFFNTCSKLLKDDGLMLLQAITIPDQRYQASLKSVDFIQKYIFPGGELPSNEIIARHTRQDTNMQLIKQDDISIHYARTLADWKHNFHNKLQEVKELGFDDVFIRMWEFYLCYCEGGFRERVIGTSQFLLAKPDYRFET